MIDTLFKAKSKSNNGKYDTESKDSVAENKQKDQIKPITRFQDISVHGEGKFRQNPKYTKVAVTDSIGRKTWKYHLFGDRKEDDKNAAFEQFWKNRKKSGVKSTNVKEGGKSRSEKPSVSFKGIAVRKTDEKENLPKHRDKEKENRSDPKEGQMAYFISGESGDSIKHGKITRVSTAKPGSKSIYLDIEAGDGKIHHVNINRIFDHTPTKKEISARKIFWE